MEERSEKTKTIRKDSDVDGDVDNDVDDDVDDDIDNNVDDNVDDDKIDCNFENSQSSQMTRLRILTLKITKLKIFSKIK